MSEHCDIAFIAEDVQQIADVMNPYTDDEDTSDEDPRPSVKIGDVVYELPCTVSAPIPNLRGFTLLFARGVVKYVKTSEKDSHEPRLATGAVEKMIYGKIEPINLTDDFYEIEFESS